MSDRLTPEREAEIAARTAAATPGPWFVHGDWPGRVFAESEFNAHIARVTGSNPEPNERFIAHAREDIPALLAELAAVRAERDELAGRALRVAASHEHFIYDHSDPGTEALAAQYELLNCLSALPEGTNLPVNLVENALRLVLAALDEWDENVTPGEIRKTLAEFLPREDRSDRRRRIYIDGKGDAWLDQSVTSDGTHWVAPLAGSMPMGAEPDSAVRERTGSLREIGRCW